MKQNNLLDNLITDIYIFFLIPGRNKIYIFENQVKPEILPKVEISISFKNLRL